VLNTLFHKLNTEKLNFYKQPEIRERVLFGTDSPHNMFRSYKSTLTHTTPIHTARAQATFYCSLGIPEMTFSTANRNYVQNAKQIIDTQTQITTLEYTNSARVLIDDFKHNLHKELKYTNNTSIPIQALMETTTKAPTTKSTDASTQTDDQPTTLTPTVQIPIIQNTNNNSTESKSPPKINSTLPATIKPLESDIWKILPPSHPTSAAMKTVAPNIIPEYTTVNSDTSDDEQFKISIISPKNSEVQINKKRKLDDKVKPKHQTPLQQRQSTMDYIDNQVRIYEEEVKKTPDLYKTKPNNNKKSKQTKLDFDLLSE
jgi:hypothetical protein